MRSMMKYILVAVALGGGALAWSQLGRSQTPPAPKWQTTTVDRGKVVAKITASGTVSPLKTVLVGSQVSGRISELAVDFNSTVTKGQVIARIDPELFKATVARANANLSAARADLSRSRALATDASRQAERAKTLLDRSMIAASESDTAAANAAAARAQVVSSGAAVEQAVAAVHEAELSLAQTTIYSPIDGVVISRSVDVGQTVAASLQAPTLFTIAEDLRKMQVDTSVAESDIGQLAAGQAVSFTVDAYPGKTFRGQVRQIRNAPTTVQNVVTYDAVIDVANPELELKPGMTANVTFIVGQADATLRVPNAALRVRPPTDAVAVHTPEGKAGMKTLWRVEGDKLVPVQVKPGLSDGARTAIPDGTIAEGDVVVTDTGEGGAAAQPARANAGASGARRGGTPF
jgi:HlyD family secretion protein